MTRMEHLTVGRVLLAIVALPLCTWRCEVVAAEKTPAPSAERIAYFSVEGFKGTTSTVNINGTSVLYQTEPNSWPLGRRWKAITKSEGDTAALIARLKALGVFEWAREYGCDVSDGVWWNLQIRREGQEVPARGFNDFPPRFADAQRAIQDFVGEPFEIPVRYCSPESKLVPEPTVGSYQPPTAGKERPPGGALDGSVLREE